MQILVVLGVGMVIYAVFGVFTTGNAETSKKQKIQDKALPTEDAGKEQKIQRLQSQVAKLESQLEEAKSACVGEKSGVVATQEKEAEFLVELKRREEWVAKAEAELSKIKTENADLNSKFLTKEHELQEEFTKNVNLTREMREIKSTLEAKDMACRLKEDQLQAQKHQLESQLKTINEHLATIAEFNRKEKISEWVPKLEFNQLNKEYTELEKELEATQEKLKSFAVEITHLRQEQDKKIPLAQETIPVVEVKIEQVKEENPQEEIKKPAEIIKEETNQESLPTGQNQSLEELPGEAASQETKSEEAIKPKPEETKTPDAASEKEVKNPQQQEKKEEVKE
ncbi:MAG: hypothetical protein NT014_04380 [Candidatus Omnitrophica bacterium]|nr:hypothetical protein [Candidatus Omnitrophota bacterium]